ncbi:flagellar hook assembly protein FlgD [Sulfobacillus harzensis]|uniref:Flagellar hook capping protein n=1 Tax=Sulfobacillus harzensis TaxID=2729629 RepID=A0A7Y0Q4T2_9FIRM|nr:flagellar hook capping FlgD N-terminal domain-containing protein [Sulfobacillus harzensis]NMP23554.1 flagellar hook capping protein [Sulfobacillus harzensis]
MSINPTTPPIGVSGTGSTTGTPASSTNSSSGIGNLGSQLNEQSFLTLLSAELKYQNPLQPMNNTQFVAELAQFSQLSAVTSQTSTLQQILSAVQGNSTNIVSASQLIGKTVTTTDGKSGQVTAVSTGSNGVNFDVSGIGTVKASDIQQVSES